MGPYKNNQVVDKDNDKEETKQISKSKKRFNAIVSRIIDRNKNNSATDITNELDVDEEVPEKESKLK